MRDTTETISGRRWRIRFVPQSKMPKDEHGRPLDGRCDWESGTIQINKAQSHRDLICTLLHEIKHASCPMLYEAESFVTALSETETRILVRTRMIGDG